MAHPQLNTTILDFYFAEPGVCNCIINIPRCLSLLNRRSYRSGYVYSVDYIEYIGTAGDIVAIGKIPESYPVLNAYRLGYDNWREQRAMAIHESDIQPGKWSDFKCWYSEEHYDGTWPEMLPGGLGTGLQFDLLDTTGSEWNYADIETNDPGAATTTRISVGMLGADNLAVGYGSLMEASGDTRVATLSPDPLTPGQASLSWITSTGPSSDEMTGQVIELIEGENDQPPYGNQADTALSPTYVGNSESAPRGILVDRSVTGTTGRSVSLNGGLIPLGMLAFEIANSGEFYVRVHCTRGDYKGVAAKSMGSFR